MIFAEPRIVPDIFGSRTIRYFRALVNLQDLTIAGLDLSKFPVEAAKYFGHFSPTLRSVGLSRPRGTRRQLLDFFRLFPKLDDIKILSYHTRPEAHEELDPQLTPITGGLRGRLSLTWFSEVWLLKDMIVAFGGMRFTSMNLREARGIQLLLETCADTLETVHVYPDGMFQHCEIVPDPRQESSNASADVALPVRPQHLNFSCNIALRSIEVTLHSTVPALGNYGHQVEELLSTVTSTAFSEIIVLFPHWKAHCISGILPRTLRKMYEIKEFRVSFCLETVEQSRVLDLHLLTQRTKAAVEEGAYDFLPCPPLVFSRAVVGYQCDRFATPVGYYAGW